jgi:hypothetical protein
MNATTKVNVGFRVKFWTEWGQNLVVCGSTRRLGGWDVRKGLWMHCQVRVVEPIPDQSVQPSRAARDSSSSPTSSPPIPAASSRVFVLSRRPRLALTHPRSPLASNPRRQHVEGSDHELLWTASVTGDFVGSFEYRYAVVDADMNVVRWDARVRTANFHNTRAGGDSGSGSAMSDRDDHESGGRVSSPPARQRDRRESHLRRVLYAGPHTTASAW